MEYSQRRERGIFSNRESAAAEADLRKRGIDLLKKHLISNMSGKKILEHDLLTFQGLTVIVRTKGNHLAANRFLVQDPERLVAIRSAPWKELRAKWDSIVSVAFLYSHPPSPAIDGLFAKK
jgi:hypothetical protein